MSKSLVEILTEASKLPRCTKDFAKDAQGKSTSPFSSDAKSFCAMGAVMRVTRLSDLDNNAARVLAAACYEATGSFLIAAANDEHPEKMDQVWKRAIAIAKKSGLSP